MPIHSIKTIKISEIALIKDRHINGFLEFLNSKLTKDQIFERFVDAEHKNEHSELLFYANTKDGITKLTTEKDMFPEVAEFFKNFYEFKY